jgi:hypothetical protein
MNFISARKQGRSVIYTGDDGSIVKYSGGDPAWRTNNPGNLHAGKISKRNNQIGKFGNFAIFPDYETGHAALIDSLRTTFGSKSLDEMILGYAPKHENNTSRYLKFLKNKTGVKDVRKIKNFTPDEFERLWRAIETYEGKKKGTIKTLTPAKPNHDKKQIVAVQKDKKCVIISYDVDGLGWVSKTEGIELARRGEIDAVIAISSAGNPYLRTRPGIDITNLEDLG